jgi:hypothetical protein
MDILLLKTAVERHVRLHRKWGNIVVCSQIWNIQEKVDIRDVELTEEALTAVSQPFIHDPSIQWSNLEKIYRSQNWWAFLSGHCSFKRSDIMRLNGWDPFFRGWGGEDNEMGYRIIRNNLDIIYTNYIKAYHLWKDVSEKEQEARYTSVLANMAYMCRKHPELTKYDRLIERRKEVEALLTTLKRHSKNKIGWIDTFRRRLKSHTLL